jgi:hypothetical protein
MKTIVSSLSRLYLILPLVVCMAQLASAETIEEGQPDGDSSFVAQSARLERVFRGDPHGIGFTEGPAVSCDGKVYFTDITPTYQVLRGPTPGPTSLFGIKLILRTRFPPTA